MPFETKVDKDIKIEINNQSTGDELTINKTVEVEGYFEHYFKELRASDRISNEVLLTSLDPESNSTNVFKAGEASGASGSFFFFSTDKRFIVKTMTEKELRFFLKEVARPYFRYLK